MKTFLIASITLMLARGFRFRAGRRYFVTYTISIRIAVQHGRSGTGCRSKPGARYLRAKRSCPASARLVTRSAPIDSIRRPKEKTRRLTKRSLRFPGVAQDSFGQLHVRGEHANLQYRIDDVLLPESIPGFGQELQTRFADNISLITGALPAQFGFRTTGVIDIHTKNGAVFQQGEASVYGGSFDTIMPSFEYGSVIGKAQLVRLDQLFAQRPRH